MNYSQRSREDVVELCTAYINDIDETTVGGSGIVAQFTDEDGNSFVTKEPHAIRRELTMIF